MKWIGDQEFGNRVGVNNIILKESNVLAQESKERQMGVQFKRQI